MLQKTWLSLLTLALVTAWLPDRVWGQKVCLPLPRLLTTLPMGGQAGTEVEITVTTENVTEPQQLHFSHPGITSAAKLDADGQPEPNRYVVSIAADCPPGLYECRVFSRLGISSSRVFSVDRFPEFMPTSPNTSLETAMELPLDSICNAVMTARAVDHYRFRAEAGQRCLIHCSSRSIDSKLDAVLIVADQQGRDLVVERRGGAIDFVAPEDGEYVIKVHELTFKGGAGYFYRLALRSLAADESVPQFASTRDVNAFSWPPVGLAETAAVAEVEPNDSAGESQSISLPCDIAGSFAKAADVDCYEFTAAAGDEWWIEVASERLGRPTNASLIVQHVDRQGAEERLTDVLEMSEIASPIKPSSNAYAYDGPPYNGGSADLLGKLQIVEDGLHRLQISDLFGGTREDPRNVYRLVIRKAAPDFALVAWGLHMELRNGDRNALSKPIAIRRGGTIALEVIALRRDGFTGEIELSIDDLPDGVTAQGLKIGTGQNRGIVLLTAHQDAPHTVGFANFRGRADVAGQAVARPVQMAAMAWPVVDAWGEIPSPRLESDVPVSVADDEFAPITITADGQSVWEVASDQQITIPLTHQLRAEFSGSIISMRTFGHGFEANPRFDLSLTENRSSVTLDMAKLKPPVGDHVIAFYGPGVVKYQYAPDQAPQDTAEIVISEPITIRVQPAESK